MSWHNPLKSSFGLEFEDLYSHGGLAKIDALFKKNLAEKNPQLFEKFYSSAKYDAALTIEISRVLEDFVVELFDIKKENDELKKSHELLQKIYYVKREFVQRMVAKKFVDYDVAFNAGEVLERLGIFAVDIDDLEKQLAERIFLFVENKIEGFDIHDMNVWTGLETQSGDSGKMFMTLVNYSRWALFSYEGKVFHKDGALFILPKKVDFQNLINEEENAIHNKNRDGFNLTDKGFALNRSLSEAHYCIFCHKQGKDSCRKGQLTVDNFYKKDPLGIELKGCPLDQKISEMNLLKSEGFSVASLAITIIDNPMVAGTGSRICNDCMKACIYQKQDAVDIPQIETRILKDVLMLPYGFEIYSLLTRWNPLNIEFPIAKINVDKKILVCGLGPAGYTLSHYLLNEGYQVTAIDGLKIEPLNPAISGIDEFGNRAKFKPIKFLSEIYEPLSSRLIQGFGGVAEYGITARWDKNFLKIIRLLLERRSNFRMFGGLRFGSSITIENAIKDYGFDHIAVCIGAGKPNIINLENNFAKGIRQASDFLMALHLGGAFRQDLPTNLQIRMPIIVVGGGLTAVDTACEAGAYYIEQIKKFSKKVQEKGRENLFRILNEEEKLIAEEFLLHHAELIKSSSNAEFLKKLGGVKILYRKKIQDSPAYKHNHQELNKALQEGIEIIDNVTPIKAKLDEFSAVEFLETNVGKFACRGLLIAAGTSPNLTPFTEDGLDVCSNKISFFGDATHKFEGNVVKAMASAKVGYKEIVKKLSVDGNVSSCAQAGFVTPPGGLYNLDKMHKRAGGVTNSARAGEKLTTKINHDFLVRIEKINRLSDHVVEVFVKAPLLANQTQIGQIFRLQNYHALAPKVDEKILAMEGVAVTALSVDRVNGIISGIVVETGGSTSLIKNFKNGEPCIFMGPSGKPTEIPKNETVLLVGGGRGNQPLTALAEAFRANGCKIIFIAGYRSANFVVRQERMENCCDKMIFAIEDDSVLKLSNSQSLQVKGTVIDAIKELSVVSCQLSVGDKQKLSTDNCQLTTKFDRIFTIGNDKMMHEIAKLRHENVVPAISEAPIAITSLNAPMQCMMKAVCSQCLQKRYNAAGEVEYFYACIEQDQNTDRLDFEHLHARCEQNSLLEKITAI